MAMRIILQCEVCGQDFRVKPSLSEKRKTCSKKCMGVLASKKYREFGTKKKPIEERFWPKVDKTPGHGPNGDCWIWKGKLSTAGYGLLYMANKNDMKGAHIISYQLNKGEIGEGLCVCHACDVRNCVRPDHLWVGTHTENMRDMARKGRNWAACGEESTWAKLTEEEVRQIISDSRKPPEIAEDYGIGVTTVRNLKAKKRWRHLFG